VNGFVANAIKVRPLKGVSVISLPDRSCANLVPSREWGTKVGNKAIETWTANGGRFASLLSNDNCERASYNQPIFETHECVVAPTLGSILPNWLLVVPRSPAVTFRKWGGSKNRNVAELIGVVLEGLEISPEQAIWFEHGPSDKGSLVGCGVDYAHIHVLVRPPFSFEEFVASVVGASGLSWRRCLATDAYGSIDAASSYLIAGSRNGTVIAEQVESAGSQFFRRIVARLADKPEQWNYNNHPHLHNVQKTIATFPRQRALTVGP